MICIGFRQTGDKRSLFFIVEMVSVSMEKCSALMSGIEDLFFYSHLKKKFLLFSHHFFQSAVDGSLTRTGSSDISFFVSFFFSITSDRLTVAKSIKPKNTLVVLKQEIEYG